MTYETDAAAVGTAADIAIAAQQALIVTRQGTVATRTATLNAKQAELAALLGTNPPPSPGAGGGLLTWSPPAGYQNYTVRTIPASGGTINLTNGVDYLIKAPDVITGQVTLNGGRNIVWIGGRIGGRKSVPSGNGYDASGRGIRIGDGSDVRTVFIEGILMEAGTYLSDGFQIANRTTNGLRVVLQNIRIDAWTWGYGDNSITGEVHADTIQCYGGPNMLLIDGLVATKSTYQGYYWDPADSRSLPTGNKNGERWTVKRVFLNMVNDHPQGNASYALSNRRPAFTNILNDRVYTKGQGYSANSNSGYSTWPTSGLFESADPPEDFVPISQWTGAVYTSPGYAAA